MSRPTPTRKSLNLKERVDVINRHNKGDTAISLARAFCVGKTQIQTIVKNKVSILKRDHDGKDSEAKYAKRQKINNHTLNNMVWEWFCDVRKRNVPVSGKMIQEKAILIFVELGMDDFVGSNGWLFCLLLIKMSFYTSNNKIMKGNNHNHFILS